MPLSNILVVLLVLALLGVFSGGYGFYRGAPQLTYGGGGLGVLVLIILVIFLFR